MRRAVVCCLLLPGLLALAACSRDVAVTTVFGDTGGLRPGDKVYLAGREVGAVASIEATEPAPGFTVALGLYPEHAELVQSNAVAYVPLASPPAVVLINPTETAAPVARDGRLRGLSPLEAAIWRAGDTADAAAGVIDQLGQRINDYLQSEDWARTRAEIELEIAELAGDSKRAADTVVEELRGLIESLGESAGHGADSVESEIAAIEREIERLEKQGHEDLVAALRRLLERLEALAPPDGNPPVADDAPEAGRMGRSA